MNNLRLLFGLAADIVGGSFEFYHYSTVAFSDLIRATFLGS